MSTKTKTKNRLTFAALPRDYAALCGILPPRTIHDGTDLANVVEIVDAMVLHDAHFTADQRDYFGLLCQLVTAYENQQIPWPKRTARQRLKHLLAAHGQTAADLSRILGASRNLGAMILRGDREITAEHARVLGAHFGVVAGAFIE